MERHSLLRDRSADGSGRATPTRESQDVFADEFAADDFDAVADGFRPREEQEAAAAANFDVDEEMPLRTVSARFASPTPPPMALSRNSIRKPNVQDNPFSSPEDDDGDGEAEPVMTFEPHRSVSSASSRMFARTSSPRLDSGPSHPYGMYPQGTLARTASVATTTSGITIRPPQRQSSNLDSAPQHPYALYPQGVEEDEDEELTPQNSVPVGFPGLGQSYRRQVGPDGEEQDIIGEDGHTEQLPPYSRYPEDGPEKMPLLGLPAAPTALHSRAPVAGTDPGMPLMHQTIQPTPTPQPQSMTDESALVRSDTRRSVAPSSLTNDSMASDKLWSEKSWKEKRKTRFCGIPVWLYILIACTFAFIAAVLGGVIGGFVMGARKHHQPGNSRGSTSLYDASAIATPTVSPPPDGTYGLALSTPQETQAACLTQANQQAAWSCNIGGAPGVAIEVISNSSMGGASLFYASASDQMSYGSQASWMTTNFAEFMAVTDNDAPESGQAFYFQTTYDKLVVLPESALSVSSSSNSNKEKRQKFILDTSWFMQKQIAQPGDRPWFCVWNNTFLEGFVYVQETINPSWTASTTSSFSSTATQSPLVTTNLTQTSSPSPASSQMAMTTQAMTMDHTTATYTGPAALYTPWEEGIAQQVHQVFDDDDDDDDRKTKKTRSDGAGKRQMVSDLYASLDIYPFVVKIEERRVAGNTEQPYCQQYVMLDNGEYNAYADSNGNPVVIELVEDDPAYSAYQSAGIAGSKRDLHARQDGYVDVPGGCHCQWMSGQ